MVHPDSRRARSILLAIVLVEVDSVWTKTLTSGWSRPFFDAGAEGARRMLESIAGVAFSITIVTLSLAMTAIGFLVFFIHHTSASIQASYIIDAISRETLDALKRLHPDQFPEFRRNGIVTFCFDEIQLVPGWEQFVRRMMDSEKVEILLSGSSARMLSREVATSMRGRAMETIITPFNFREFLFHKEIPLPGGLVGARERSALIHAFDDYLATGGFPEAVSVTLERDRIRLLQGYVDAVLFRDVAERHSIGNLVALRAFVRQLLRHPASPMSVSRISADFHSRGVPASKETLLAFLDHLVDAFLVFTVPIFSRSERRRQVNPRKLYLADHALAAAFSPASGLDQGHLLENIVACELMRQSRDLAYYRTRDGFEVDFLATSHEGSEHLVQVCADLSDATTRAREVRALESAGKERPSANRTLLCMGEPPPDSDIPPGLQVVPIWKWLFF